MDNARIIHVVVVAAAGAVGALGAGVAIAATTADGMQAVGHGHAVDAGFGADRMTLSVRSDGTRHLTFSRLSSRVELMGVAPAADRTSASMENWALAWKRLYGRTEPNVIVTYGKGGHRIRESYTLARARYYRAKGTMDFTLRPMATGARGRPPLTRPGTRLVKATRRQLGPGTVFVQQAGRRPGRPGVDVSHSAGRITLRTTPSGVQHLVLKAYAPSAEMTGVAPSHDRAAVPTALWARNFARMYRGVKPNAILSYGRGAGARRASVLLKSMRFNPVKGTMDFVVKPLGYSPLPWVAPGASASLGSGVLFVDQTVDFGSQTAVQTQATLNALVAMGLADDVANNVYSCCAVGSSPVDVQNELASGWAYDGLVMAPGFSGVIAFSDSPAFGTFQMQSGQSITFDNGLDMDGATFGLTGSGAFRVGGGTLNFGQVPPWGPPGSAGTNGLVIFNGDFTNSTITGALGGDSALIGGSMSGSTIDGLQVNSAVLDNVSFSGATFTSAPTEFNDSAVVGVTFSGARIASSLGFYGSSMQPAQVASPTGGSTTKPTSFANLSGSSFDFGASQDPDEADSWPIMSQVDFSGSSWSEFSVSDTVMQGNNFANASLGSRPSFTSVSIDNATSFDQVAFGSPTFSSCAFNGTDLTNAQWTSPEFTGSAESPTVLEGVTFSSATFKTGSGYSATFENVTFSGTTFVGLSAGSSADVAFVSGIMTSTGVKTDGLGLIAFNTQYVQGSPNADGTPNWYQVNPTGTEWTPIDSVTLAPSGPPTNVDPVPSPDPDPAP